MKKILAAAAAAACLAAMMPQVTFAADAVRPTFTAMADAAPGTTYFTGKEWTGEVNSRDIHGDPVKQSAVFGVNREAAHATDTQPYDTVDNAIAGAVSGDWTHSPYYQLLTGEGQNWQLTVYRNMEDAAEVANRFYAPDYTGAAETPYTGSGVVQDYAHADYGCGWRTVTLPAGWQTQGFDFSIYTNINTPWKGVYGNEGAGMADKDLVPAVPTVTNPVGFYRRTFDVDADWLENGRRVFVSFQGVESAMYLYVNGYEVGYTEDSYDAHDFDITPYLTVDGKDNLLAVRVHRWCDGSWLEDQDVLRMGGIFRDVFLYTTEAVYIRDYKVETNLDDAYTNATLSLSVQVADRSGEDFDAARFGVQAQLFDADGASVTTLETDVAALNSGGETSAALSKLVRAPRLWSDEDPYLYTLVLSLIDRRSGARFATVSQQLGFRKITFTKTAVDRNYNNVTPTYDTIRLNGKPLLFRGVNRHDNNPATGKYVPHELYETDIRIMKENNINAVRTSHYPDDRYFYYLCDKYGILVMAETNAESHALQGDSDVMARYFTESYRDRLTANIQAQKNRACVVMWSLGNECGDTPQTKMFQKAIQEVVRPLDATRPVHYEGLQGRGGVDVYSNMYPSVETLADRGRDANHMPYVLCEYVFSMGNSTGNLKEYWDQIRAYDNLIGAFVWDFVDKTVTTPLPVSQVLTVDKSRYNLKASLEGTIADSDTWGKALTEGYVVVQTADALDEALSGRRPFTLEMQLNPHGSGTYQSLMCKSDHQVSLRVYDDRRLDLVLFADGDWRVSSFRLPANWRDNWHHLAVTFDGTHTTMYCDGTKLTRTDDAAVTAAIPRSDYPFAINYDAETGRTGDNEVALARVYARQLTPAEIAAQGAADHGRGDYAVAPDDESVRLWLDFAAFTDADYHEDTDGVWDYYGNGHYFGYGGDWGKAIHDGSYMCDGLVSADRTVQPEMQEVKYVQQPIWFSLNAASGEVTITNELRFVDTSRYVFEWELIEDGKAIQSGAFDAAVAPLDQATVTLPYTLPSAPKAGAEYFVNLRAVWREDCGIVKAGTVAAHEQAKVALETAKVAPVVAAACPAVTVTDGDTLTLTGERFTLTFDKASGSITNYTYDDQTLLTGFAPNYWRAQMDSDRQNSAWRAAGRTAVLADMQVREMTGAVRVTVTLALPDVGNSKQTYVYTVYGSGEIHVDATLTPDAVTGELLKVGAEWILPDAYEQIRFYGEGPQECYIDRRQGAEVGLYDTTVSDSFFPFVRPQTSGNHTGVRWMALTAENSPVGLAVVGAQPLEASALPYRIGDYAGRSHPYEMPKTDYTVLNVDMISAGLGGGACGPSTREEYRLYPDHTYAYSYTLLPFDRAADDMMERSKAWRADTAGEVPVAVDRTALRAAIADEVKDLAAYTDASARAYATALAAAKELVEQTDATQAAVDAATKALIDAKAALVRKPVAACGDVNGDGAVDTADAVLVLQRAAELIGDDDLQAAAADVNADGAIDTADAVLILQKAAELIERFPAEG